MVTSSPTVLLGLMLRVVGLGTRAPLTRVVADASRCSMPETLVLRLPAALTARSIRANCFCNGVIGVDSGLVSCPIAWVAGKVRKHSRKAGRSRPGPAKTDRRNE